MTYPWERDEAISAAQDDDRDTQQHTHHCTCRQCGWDALDNTERAQVRRSRGWA